MGVVAGVLPGRLNLTPDALHGTAEVAVAGLVLRPARREKCRQAVQCVDGQAAVIGEGRESR
jgi:hypothetical protein